MNEAALTIAKRMHSHCDIRAGTRRASIVIAATLLTALLVLLVAGESSSAKQRADSEADQVRTATSEFRKGDRVKTVDIGRTAWQKARSIMSLSPREVGELVPGRTLSVSADAEITVCAKPNGGHVGTPCVGRTYGYDPYLKMKIVAGPSPGSIGGSNTVDLTSAATMTCSQHQPNRNRHCVLGIPWSKITIPAGAELPCGPSNCYVNLVLSANRSTARSGDVVVVGSSNDNREISQGRGQLSSILFTGSDKELRSFERTSPRSKQLKVQPDDSKSYDQVAYSLPLNGLERGDQIIVEGKSVTQIGSLPYNVTQRSSLIFTDSPGSVQANGKIIESNPHLSADNGYGCTQGPSGHRNPCTVLKNGIISVKESSDKTWYVNFVVSQEASDIAPKANRWRSSDRVEILSSGYLKAWKYRGVSSCGACAIGGTGAFHFSPTALPGSKLFKRLVGQINAYGIDYGSYRCEGKRSGPYKMVCEWQAEGSFGQSRPYVCDSKAFLSQRGNWSLKVCKDALGAQLWHLLQQRNIEPFYAGNCEDKGPSMYKCKWYARGEWQSGPYFCRGYGTYSAKNHQWSIDPCRNER